MNKNNLRFFEVQDKMYMLENIAYSSETDSNVYILKDMENGKSLVFNEEEIISMKELTEDDVYIKTKTMDNNEYVRFMDMIGAYRCPFCGGKLHWESDFMTSEVRGLEGTYYQITEEERINLLKEIEEEYIKSNLMGETDDIEEEKRKASYEGTYKYMYLKYINKDGDVEYWTIDDPVIGIYHCDNCCKNYEIQDPYEHEIE